MSEEAKMNMIAFIICVNDEMYFEECKYYIEQLDTPTGYSIDVIGIWDANSMCAAYNLGMQSSDAKYKVYMHQDVFIRDRHFVEKVLRIFQNNEEVGMIGMVGGIGVPRNGVVYPSWNVGRVDCREPDLSYVLLCGPEQTEDVIVDAIDGLLIATQYDLPWREDLLRDFDFYDVSQAFEFRRAGYKIVVPYQEMPWVIHDCGFAKLRKYDRNRRICLREYPEFFTDMEEMDFFCNDEWERLSSELASGIKRMIDQGVWDEAAKMIRIYRKNQMKSSELEIIGIISDIERTETQMGTVDPLFAHDGGYKAAYQKYMSVRFLLRRMELGMPKQDYQELLDAVRDGYISVDAIMIIVLHAVLDKDRVLSELERCGMLDRQSTDRLKVFHVKIQNEAAGIPLSYSKRAKRELEKTK